MARARFSSTRRNSALTRAKGSLPPCSEGILRSLPRATALAGLKDVLEQTRLFDPQWLAQLESKLREGESASEPVRVLADKVDKRLLGITIIRILGVTQFDFAADSKPAKNVARRMILLSREITAKLPEVTGKPAAEVTRMRCATCHRGGAVPRLLPDILVETVNKSGGAAAVQQYRDLRKQYYGGQSYDFSENALVPVALQLTNSNKPDEALALLQVNAEFHRNSAPTYGGMAQAYLKKNDKENAIKNFEKVLQLDPNNQQAKRQLEQLKASK